MKTYTVAAPAKINLTLEVVGRLPNGFHAIRSVMLRLPRFADVVTLRIDERRTGLSATSDHPGIAPDEGNLCHRAAAAFLAATRRSAGVEVHIAKRIPVAAGLGGGSSDAAAVLATLNRHFGTPCSPGRLATIAAEIGKDLPFFLQPAPVALATGMGERLRPLPPPPRLHVLLVNPGVAIATRDAYAEVGRRLWFMADPRRSHRSRAMARAIAGADVHAIAAALYNDFERAAEGAHPIIAEIKHCLRAFGGLGALMSGSGSTIFGLFDTARACAAAAAVIRARYPALLVAAA